MMSIAFSKRILLLDSGWVGISQSQVGGKPSFFFVMVVGRAGLVADGISVAQGDFERGLKITAD